MTEATVTAGDGNVKRVSFVAINKAHIVRLIEATTPPDRDKSRRNASFAARPK